MKPEARNTFAKILLPLATLLIMGVLIGCDIIGRVEPIPVVPPASFKVAIKGSALVNGKINFGGKLTVQISDNKLPGETVIIQWTREGFPISGATNEEYTILKTDEDKTIGVNVTIRNDTVAAAGIAIPKRAITITVGGSAFNDKGIVGKDGALKAEATKNWVAEDKDGKELPTTYQWVRESANISGATKEEYVLTADDVGKTLTCKTTYDSVSGTSTGIKIPTTSTQTKTLQAAILGTPKVGEYLTADVIKNFSGEITYQWQRNGEDIPYEDWYSFYVRPLDSDKAITVKVTCGTEKATSPAVTIPSITYTVKIGTNQDDQYANILQALVYITGLDDQYFSPDNDYYGFSIQWFSNGAPISNAKSRFYYPNAGDAGKKIMAKVSGNGKVDVPSNEFQISPILGTWETKGYEFTIPEDLKDDDGNVVGPAGEYTIAWTLHINDISHWYMYESITGSADFYYWEDNNGNYRVNGSKVYLFKELYRYWDDNKNKWVYSESSVFSAEGGTIRNNNNEIVFSKAIKFSEDSPAEDLVFTRIQ